MKPSLLLFCLTFLTLCSSCVEQEKISIEGKWWSFDRAEKHYSEYDIDKNSISVFSHYMGNQGSVKYKINGDVLYFQDRMSIVGIVSANLITMTNGNKTDSLFRLPENTMTYNSLDHPNDSIFDEFYKKFQSRAHQSWINNGFLTYEEQEESIIDTLEIEEIDIPVNE